MNRVHGRVSLTIEAHWVRVRDLPVPYRAGPLVPRTGEWSPHRGAGPFPRHFLDLAELVR
jgi:hypothetical protein